jgi:predicted polyphosphate/ATP-dependent NAD kinase
MVYYLASIQAEGSANTREIDMKRIGLIVNPIAGLGGRVGLKGSDSLEIQQRALELGASPRASDRATETLKCLLSMKSDLDILTCLGSMGEIAVTQAGFNPQLVDAFQARPTTAEDTKRAVHEMMQKDLSLLIFAGGDGTARDIYSAIQAHFPCLGIPAGVKMHSAVFATTPKHAGELAKLYLEGIARLHEAEVLDIDEEAYREGKIITYLYGHLSVPYRPLLLQNQKMPSPTTDTYQAKAIATEIIEQMQTGVRYILGPGTTTRAIADALNVEKTLVGVDVICDGRLIGKDVTQEQLISLIEAVPAQIIVTPIGGQGFLFGRGNQQIGPEVIRKVGRENIIVASTFNKLRTLHAQPFIVDTGDTEVDTMLTGYITVITGYKEHAIYRIIA